MLLNVAAAAAAACSSSRQQQQRRDRSSYYYVATSYVATRVALDLHCTACSSVCDASMFPSPLILSVQAAGSSPLTMPTTDFHPVLIVPGFMSSGLEVKASDTKSWVGKRVFLNLNQLGFESIHSGSALVINESLRASGNQDYSEEKHQEYERQYACKSKWLHHLSLSSDLVTERSHIKVRPIQGLNGVDYLTPGALTSQLSYVFGPVIRALFQAGFTESNLEAAPYDWRIPPTELERRDKYFSNTMRQVEDIYKRNNNTPVILLCHSLGCKTGHYLLNFAKDTKGQGWIDRHIHAYAPVGAPHLGAPKSLRALVDGDKMGLDTFLSDEEGLILGRSLGSGPWLVPRELSIKSKPIVYIRREGALKITVPPIDCTELLNERKKADTPPQLRLLIRFGKDTLTTDFQSASWKKGKLIYKFHGMFSFPTPEEIPNGSDREGRIVISIQERGIAAAKDRKQKSFYESSPLCFPVRCAVNIICCPIKYILCLPCTVFGCFVKGGKDLTLGAANATAIVAGAGTDLGRSEEFSLASIVSNERRDGKLKKKLVHVLDNRKAIVSARVQWVAPKELIHPQLRQASPMAVLPKGAAYTTSVKHHKKKKHVKYDVCDGCELLANEGMDKTLKFVHSTYEKDPLGPRTRSAVDPPPVRRVFAIFGVNLPTEVGAVYRRQCLLVKGDHVVQKLHEVDKSARLVSDEAGISIKGGVLVETGDGSSKAGDGTVPFSSMDQCRKWNSDSCKVEVVELEGAEHRAILADDRFHQTVIDFARI